MTMLLVSSTEPKKFRDLLPSHKMSIMPERFGCDVLWPVNGAWWGIQRKELRDFIASVQDGRLAKELGQMKQTVMPTVIIEGQVRFTDDKLQLGRHGTTVTEKQYRGMVYSMARMGVQVLHTGTHSGTATEVEYLIGWSAKDRHNSLLRRPGPVGRWGKADSREYQEHLLQGVVGVGPELAGRIIDKFGGVPLQWTVTVDDLMTIEGIGKTKAKSMIEAVQS